MNSTTNEQASAASAPNANAATFDSLSQETAQLGDVSLDNLLDVPVTLSLEVGRMRMSIQELLKLGPGSVVELDRAAGEPLDVYVNQHLIARGEVVVVNDRFGVRLTEVVSPSDRIKRLGN